MTKTRKAIALRVFTSSQPSPGASRMGWSCRPSSAAAMVSGTSRISATSERGLAAGGVLPQGDKVVMPPVEQHAEVGRAAGQPVVCGDGKHDRFFTAQMALDRHGDRRVRNAVRQLGERIARAWCDDEYVEHGLRPDGLGGRRWCRSARVQSAWPDGRASRRLCRSAYRATRHLQTGPG